MRLKQDDIECLHAAKRMIPEDAARHYTIQQIATAFILSPTKLKKGFKMVLGAGLF